MDDSEVNARLIAVQRYRQGEKPATVCASLGRSRRWFYKWLKRSQEGGPQWFLEQSRRPKGNSRQTPDPVEQQVVDVRQELDAEGLFCGDQAIAWRLEEKGLAHVPSLSTIGRILSRHDLVQRQKKRFEPKGKKYPALQAAAPGQVHQVDFVGPCFLKGPVRFYSLHSIDVASACCAVEPMPKGKAAVVDALWAIWRRLGLPQYVQVDNEWVFFGSPAHPRGMGNLIRLCLPLDIEPVFIPMNEPWRNGVVEKFNHHWAQKFVCRTLMLSAEELKEESLAFEQRHNARYRYRKLDGKTPLEHLELSKVPLRFPSTSAPDQRPLPKPETGRYHVIRFIRSDGMLDLFSEKFSLPPETHYEYVQATVDVSRQRLSVRLDGRLIEEVHYQLR
jgi:transposase InsO family protein